MADPYRVAGFDPGTARTGFAVVESSGREFRLVEAGLIETKPAGAPEHRLHELAEKAGAVLATHHPASVAIEELFFSKNTTTAMRVSEARGVLMAAVAAGGLSVAEYGPGTIKQQLTGYGSADKVQVAHMVCRLVGLKEPPRPDDITDAIAIALCHAMRQGVRNATR
ncbi:MAG: crossover junction endodeoxyribonuclease RuvC [bacterium]|nr:crossover junction endodeoxyribonuclease RuvC [bacterium]